MFFDKIIGDLYGEPIKSELAYRRVYNYLDKYMKCLNYSQPSHKVNRNVKENKTIWILWYQEIETAPKLIKKCYESIIRNKPEEFDVIVLSKKNLKEYVCIPTYIYDKLNRGIISKTHFSDILRTELLNVYGGCWIDATVYCSAKIPPYMLDGSIFLFKWSKFDKSILKMSSWWIYSQKEMPIFCELRDLLYSYWEKEMDIRNYYLFHIAFSKIIDSNSNYRVIFQEIPYFNNSNPHVLYGKMAQEYDIDAWQVMKDISPVHKLSYKRKFMRGDIYNFYTALLEDKLI